MNDTNPAAGCGHVRCRQLGGECELYDSSRTITAIPAGRDRHGNPLTRRTYVIDRRPEDGFSAGKSRIFAENRSHQDPDGRFIFTPAVVLTDSIESEADRQRLVRDGQALLDFARDVEKLAQDAPHTGPFTAHGYTARIHALLAVLNEGDAS